MNSAKVMSFKTQVEFQTAVNQIPGDRYEFKGIKAYVFTHGKSRPVKFFWKKIR